MSLSIPQVQRAAVLHALNEDVHIVTDHPVVQPSELLPGQCLVNIEFSGVCHSDLTIRNGKVPYPPKLPLVGGHEGVGRVVAIGEHTQNKNVNIGDRVGIKYLAESCLDCEMCRKGAESRACFHVLRSLCLGS